MPKTGNRTETLTTRERINVPLTAPFVAALAAVGIVTAVDAINALAKVVKYDGECIPPFAGRPVAADSFAALTRALAKSGKSKALIRELIAMVNAAEEEEEDSDE